MTGKQLQLALPTGCDCTLEIELGNGDNGSNGFIVAVATLENSSNIRKRAGGNSCRNNVQPAMPPVITAVASACLPVLHQAV